VAQVVLRVLKAHFQVHQVRHYQATQDKLVKGNHYEYNSKKN
jgi:hypothetical protein